MSQKGAIVRLKILIANTRKILVELERELQCIIDDKEKKS